MYTYSSQRVDHTVARAMRHVVLKPETPTETLAANHNLIQSCVQSHEVVFKRRITTLKGGLLLRQQPAQRRCDRLCLLRRQMKVQPCGKSRARMSVLARRAVAVCHRGDPGGDRFRCNMPRTQVPMAPGVAEERLPRVAVEVQITQKSGGLRLLPEALWVACQATCWSGEIGKERRCVRSNKAAMQAIA